MSHVIETLVERELSRTVNPPVDILKAPVLAEAIENILNDKGIYIGNVFRNDKLINIFLETSDEKTALFIGPRLGGRVETLNDFIEALPSVDKKAFPHAEEAADEIRKLCKSIDRLQELSERPSTPKKNRPRKDVYLVCVYRSDIEPHGNDDNLSYIEVEEKDLKDFLEGPLEGEYTLDQFLEEYTADDTQDLPLFLEKRNKLVLPEEVLFTRAVVDFYLSTCKYAEDFSEHSKDFYEEEAENSSDDSLLYVIKEDFLPHMPSSKRKDAEQYWSELDAGKIPSRSLKSKVVENPKIR